jgi:hypothetical protein
MTLAEFAELAGAQPRWCQNALSALRRPFHYTVRDARRLGLARLIAEGHGVALARAWRRAGEALASDPASVFSWSADEEVTTLTLDLPRYLSDFTVKLSNMRRNPPRARGRPRQSRRYTGLDAEAWGLDLDALREHLKLSPSERLRSLDQDQQLLQAFKEGRRSA